MIENSINMIPLEHWDNKMSSFLLPFCFLISLNSLIKDKKFFFSVKLLGANIAIIFNNKTIHKKRTNFFLRIFSALVHCKTVFSGISLKIHDCILNDN